jgi:hypothetical protein
MSEQEEARREQQRQQKIDALQRIAKSNEQLAQTAERTFALKVATLRSSRIDHKELCALGLHEIEYNEYREGKCKHCRYCR